MTITGEQEQQSVTTELEELATTVCSRFERRPEHSAECLH